MDKPNFDRIVADIGTGAVYDPVPDSERERVIGTGAG